MIGWYETRSASSDDMQRKADEQRAQEAAAASEWEAAWERSKARARDLQQASKRQYDESQKPLPTLEQDMAAIRALLEAQASQKESKNG